MNKKALKDWTVLIYANGNNELEPEVWKSMLDAERTGSDENVNIVIQIGRESSELVKLMRPYDNLLSFENSWTGVRRYYITKGKSQLIEDLGKENMADPKSLYNFITWGLKQFPAKRNMLLLSGHGAAFIAVMPDLSQSFPCMMGVAEMCKVLNMIKHDTGANIDILTLDMCCMNIVELMYELGKDKDNTVKNVLTYVVEGPIEGMGYDRLMDTIKYNYSLTTEELLKKIVGSMDLNLLAVSLNQSKLKRIKECANRLAFIYLTAKKENQLESARDILANYSIELNEKIYSIVLCHSLNEADKYKVLNIYVRSMCNNNDERIQHYLYAYYKFSFCKNNFWFHMFANKSTDEPIIIKPEVALKPYLLEPKQLINFIKTVNPFAEESELRDIAEKLYDFKNWEKLSK